MACAVAFFIARKLAANFELSVVAHPTTRATVSGFVALMVFVGLSVFVGEHYFMPLWVRAIVAVASGALMFALIPQPLPRPQ